MYSVPPLFFVLFSLQLISCSTAPSHNYSFIAIPDTINKLPTKELTEEQVVYDLRQLKFALQNVYSGSKFLPRREWKHLIHEINGMENKKYTAQSLCLAIDRHFSKVSDNHLKAKLNDKKCHLTNNKRTPGVGKNFYLNQSPPWSVKYQTKKQFKALLISITSFPQRSSSVWNGFLEKVERMIGVSDLVVIDMRGNGGGDDRIGYELAEMFAGSSIKTPYSDQWTNTSPSALQIIINTIEYWSREQIEKGEKVATYITDLKKKFIDKRDRALKGEKVELNDTQGDADQDRTDFNWSRSIKKPIYLLVDAACGSSCESTTDYFEMIPFATTVGENTAGYIHFGNNGSVFLKNSGIRIQMAISYNTYRDGRFLEKKGISPEIKVPRGKDALAFAWKDFLKDPERRMRRPVVSR